MSDHQEAQGAIVPVTNDLPAVIVCLEAAVVRQVRDLELELGACSVEDEDGFRAADVAVGKARKFLATIKEKRLEVKRPVLALASAIDKAVDDETATLHELINGLGTEIVAYQREAQRRYEEAEAERRRAEREAQAALAAAAPAPTKGKGRPAADPPRAPAPALPPKPAPPPRASSTVARKQYSVRVDDITQVPPVVFGIPMLKVDTAAALDLMKPKGKGRPGATIPGLTLIEEERPVGKGGRR